MPPLQDSDVDRDSDRERDYGENSDSVPSDYGSGEKKKKKKHKERKEKKTKKKKKDDGDRDSCQEEATKVMPLNPLRLICYLAVLIDGFSSAAARAEDLGSAGEGVGSGGC